MTCNWGTKDDDTLGYHNGNSDPRGFGHIGIAVPSVYGACKRFEELGVKFVKKPDEGEYAAFCAHALLRLSRVPQHPLWARLC